MEHLEGQQSILAALQARQRRIDVILLAHGAHEEKFADLLALAEHLGVPIRRVDRKELDALAHAGSHGGIIAIASPKPRLSVSQLNDILDASPTKPLLLLLEGIEDARNLGFVLRTAEAMGAQAVLIKKHLWDFDAIEIARPASGAYERLPLVQIEDVAPLKALQNRGIKLYGCIGGVKRTIHDMDLRQPCILAIGGEKRGLSGAVRDICDQFVAIPSAGGPSSLSLSHASAIVLAEAFRQRRPARPIIQDSAALDATGPTAAQ